jgi:hypothetical protein
LAGPDKVITTTKFAGQETVFKDQEKSVTLEHKDCPKESKLLNNQQLPKRDKDLAKISDLLVLQGRLLEANLTLREVMREDESYKKLHKSLEWEAPRLPSRVDGQAKKKRAHSKEMSLLAVQKQQLALETQCKQKQAPKEKLQYVHQEEKHLIKYTAQIRGKEKAKDLAAKGQI